MHSDQREPEDRVYWLVTGGQAKQAIEQHRAMIRRFHDDMDALCIALVGKKSDGVLVTAMFGGVVSGLKFSACPGDAWREVKGNRGYYAPNGKTAEGRRARAEICKIQYPPTTDFVRALFGCSMLTSGLLWWTPGVREYGRKTVVVGRDLPEGAKAVDGLRRLKASEYWAMRERAEARIRKSKTE